MGDTTEPQRLTVTQLADRLGVSVASVRRYADRYTDQLSSYASARPRTFTERDAARLSVAVRMTRQGDSAEAVAESIQDLQAGDIAPPVTALEAHSDALPTALTPSVEYLVSRAVDAKLRQVVSEQTRLSYLATGIVIGVIVSLVMFAFTVWIVGPP